MSSSSLLGLPKVLLMGLRKSGKSSIQKVVFEGMQPHDSVSLPTTVQPDKSTVRSNDFINFEVWDFPGQNDPFDAGNAGRYDAEQLLENCGAIVFVMDCRELIDDSRARLVDTICAAYSINPELSVEVFIHKVDALSEDHQSDLLATLQRRVEEEAKQRLENTSPLRLNFNLTSIYDHSVFHAFSLVVQKLIRKQAPYITELLQMLNSNSSFNLSYLFLSQSKIYLAVDERNRLKARTYDLCSDAVEVLAKMNRIYTPHANVHRTQNGPGRIADAVAVSPAVPAPLSQGEFDGAREGDWVSVGVGQPQEVQLGSGSAAVIHLSSDDCIYLRDLPNALTLVMMMKKEALQSMALINYNISVFYKATHEILAAVASGTR